MTIAACVLMIGLAIHVAYLGCATVDPGFEWLRGMTCNVGGGERIYGIDTPHIFSTPPDDSGGSAGGDPGDGGGSSGSGNSDGGHDKGHDHEGRGNSGGNGNGGN